MQDLITYQLVESVVSSLVVAGGVWIYFHNKMSAIKDDLQAFKLEVAKEYVSTAHLNEVEERLMRSMNDLSESIKQLRTEILNLSRNR